jgi:hypothetical protein
MKLKWVQTILRSAASFGKLQVSISVPKAVQKSYRTTKQAVQESNMPIVNSVYESKNLFASEFFCPNCLAIQRYELKRVSREIYLSPVSLLEANQPGQVIECQACRNAFDAEILRRNVQSLYKLAGAAKYQLDKGISPGFLKLQLVSDGLKESFAEMLISLAQQ